MANKDDDKNKDESKDMKSIFEKYTEAAGNKGKILLKDAKKWFEEANISGKKPENTDSEFDESFAKAAKDKASMTYEEFKSYIQNLSKDVKVEVNELVDKLVASQRDKTEDAEDVKDKNKEESKDNKPIFENEFIDKLVASQRDKTEDAEDEKHKNKDESKDIKSIFEKYTEAAGNKGKILLEDAKKWFEEANIIGKKPGKTESEFGESFAKVAKDKASMSYEEFQSYIQTLSKDVKVEANELIDKLVASQKDKTEDAEGKAEKAKNKTK